jgi:hypothetical protein
MNNKIVTIILFLASTFQVFAQSETTQNGTPCQQKRAISLAYYGYQITNPGVLLGMENYLATTKNFQIVAGLDLKFQQKQEQFGAIGINARIGQRYTANFGLMLETHLGFGIQQTFYNSKVYDLTTKPITESSVKSSQLGFNPNINFGIGYDFSKKTNLPIVYYIRPSINWLLPDKNLVFQINPSLETGIIYKLGFRK